MQNKLILGLDTGGTHTDAVVFDPRTKSVLATAKASTTHHDLTIGLNQALENLSEMKWEGGLKAIELINLSTTLATNAIAEGKGSQVGLILMGYDQDQAAVRALVSELNSVSTAFVAGSHDFYGRQDAELDEEALAEAVKTLEGQVDAWAISGFFSVKNPAHEMRAVNIVKALSAKPITTGQSLTGQLNAVRRAATAALNAGLVVIINRLLNAVKEVAGNLGLTARLMVVRGDGTLVSEDWAREKPIETVVSGPAAGLVGAKLLARGLLGPAEKNLWVMDVGGTTTDLAYVENGLPAVNPNGARVGQWDTMTVAVETRTRGLGGDSLVSLDKEGSIVIGPRRVLPLCRLGEQWPLCVDELDRQNAVRMSHSTAGHFFIPGIPAGPGLNEDEEAILDSLDKIVPYSMARYSAAAWAKGRFFIGLRAVTHPAVMVSAFTPTDAMTVLGLFSGGSLRAATLGATLLGRPLGLSPDEFARQVLDEFGRLMTQEILTYAFNKEKVEYSQSDFKAAGLLGQALTRRPVRTLEMGLKMTDTIVLLGAPVAILMPWLGKYLAGRILVPPIFDVASAAGAAASPIQLKRQVEIQAMPNFTGYRLFLPDRVVHAVTMDELLPVAEKAMDEHMRGLARLAGAEQISIAVTRADRRVSLNDGSKLNLGAILTFKAREA